MSTVSKIPQNRASRIAGPSKLPSRILRPTFANKPSSATTNFVNSAKQIEKKKDAGKVSEQSEIVFKGRPKSLHIPSSARFEKVDCNGNKRDFVLKNSAEEGDIVSLSNPFELDGSSANPKYYEMQKPTVNGPNASEKKCDSTSNNVQYQKNKMSNTATNFRSIKPGYFLQKVSAIKSSQQHKSSENTTVTEPQTNAIPNKMLSNSYGRSTVTHIQPEATSSDANARSATIARVWRHILPRGTSRLEQLHSAPREAAGESDHSGTQPPSRQMYSTRAEKRKKYLEMRNSKSTNADDKPSKENVTQLDKVQEKGDRIETESSVQTEVLTRRPYVRKPPLRSAKIARPVIRPKKTPSPITPKPFVLEPFVQKTPHESKYVAARPTSSVDADIIDNFLNESHEAMPSLTTEALNSRKVEKSASSETVITSHSAEKICDDYSVDSIASEESGYSSVASTIYLDTRVNGTEASTRSPSMNFYSTRATSAHLNESDPSEKHSLLNGHSSNSLSDVLSIELEKDPRDTKRATETQRYSTYVASKDIVTFGQYRLRAEGNYSPEERYGLTEAHLIRTSSSSSSDIAALRDVQSSPDCENTSDSSAETVIQNTKSPNPLDQLDKNDLKREDDLSPLSENGLEGFDEKTSNLPVAETQSDSRFFSAANETFFATAMLTPEPNQPQPDTPSTSSTSKAKKRKTDSLTSPIMGQDKNNCEHTGEKSPTVRESVQERRTLFKGDEAEQEEDGNLSEDDFGDGEENLSEMLDLPSMHESALMGDYNSLLDDDYPSDEEKDGNTDDARMRADNSRTASAQTNVINKLLCQGFNGIVSSDDISSATLHDDESVPLMNGCHYTESAKAANSATPSKRTGTNIHSVDNSLKIQDRRNQDDLRAEVRMMKMLLIELHRTLEAGEADRERQIEENKRLQLKNHKLAQIVESLSQELTSIKLCKPLPSGKSKAVQVSVKHVDSSTDTSCSNTEVASKQDVQTSTSPRWFHSEVSDEVESNIKRATEEIKQLKDLRGDFDRRINDAEQRLNCTLQLFHR